MKNFFVTGLLLFGALNIFGQAKDQVKFTAKITNRNSDSLVIVGGDNFRKVIKIGSNDLFAANFEAPKGFYKFSDGTESSTLFLLPNSEVNLTIDAKEFDETILYKGKGVNESNFLAQYLLESEKFQEEAFKKDQSEFTKLLEEKTKADKDKLNKGDFDPVFKSAIEVSFDQFSGYAVGQYNRIAQMRKLDGSASPEFDYVNHKGGKTKLSDFRGKYVYIDLWATWCGPCRQEIPYLQKIEEKYHGKNIEFVSISIDNAKDNEKWKKFVSDKNLGGVQLFADKDWESEFVVKYGVTGIPRFILIDPKGTIVNSDAARPSAPELQVQLDTLLH